MTLLPPTTSSPETTAWMQYLRAMITQTIQEIDQETDDQQQKFESFEHTVGKAIWEQFSQREVQLVMQLQSLLYLRTTRHTYKQCVTAIDLILQHANQLTRVPHQ